MNNKISICLVFFLITACNFDANNHYAYNIGIFKHTHIWDVAKALESHKQKKLENLLSNNVNINYRENEFGMTLLHWSVYNDFLPESRILIKYGADPFLKMNDGRSVLELPANEDSADVYYSVLLRNVKIEDNDKVRKEILSKALISLCGNVRNKQSISSANLLLIKGADINYINFDSTTTPLSASLTQNNMKLAKFLLMNKKANYNVKLNESFGFGGKVTIKEILNNQEFDRESDDYLIKEELINYIDLTPDGARMPLSR